MNVRQERMMAMRQSMVTGERVPMGFGDIGQGLRAWWRLFAMEFRRSPALWAALLMAATTAWVMWDQLPVGVVRWREVNLSAADVLLPGSAIAAATGALVASRDDRLRLEDQLLHTTAGRARRDIVALVAAIVWCGSGYLIAVAGFFAYTAVNATWGGPMWGQVVLPLATFAASVPGGWLVGSVFRNRLAVVVAAGIAFALHAWYPLTAQFRTSEVQVSPNSTSWRINEGWYQMLLPMEVLAFADLWSMVGLSVIWILSAGVMLFAIASWWRHREGASLGLLGIAVMIGAMVTVPLATASPEHWARRAAMQQIPHICEERPGGQVEVCLHPEDVALMDETGAVLERLMKPIAGIPGVPMRFLNQPGEVEAGEVGIYVYDETDLEFHVVATALREIMREPQGDFVPWMGSGEYVIQAWLLQEYGVSLEEATTRQYIGPMFTVQRVDEARAAGITDPMELNNYLNQTRLTGDPQAFRAQVEAAIARFVALSPEDQRAWLAANWEALRAGELTLEDLP